MEQSYLIEKYQAYLLKKASNKSLKFSLREGTPAEKEEGACAIFRYAITELLQWTSADAALSLTPELMETLGLTHLLTKYVNFPSGTIVERDVELVVHHCFNEPHDETKAVIATYDAVLRGDIPAFPKNYFDEALGRRRAQILLREFNARYVDASTIPELYRKYSDKTTMKELFKKYKIAAVSEQLYNHVALEWLHDTLSDEQKNHLLFALYSYKRTVDRIKRRMRK